MPDAFHILNKSFLPCLRKYLKHITKQGVSAVNVRVYMHGHTQTRAHTQTHTQTHSHTHTHTHADTHKHAHAHTHTWTQANTRTHTHTHTHTHTLHNGLLFTGHHHRKNKNHPQSGAFQLGSSVLIFHRCGALAEEEEKEEDLCGLLDWLDSGCVQSWLFSFTVINHSSFIHHIDWNGNCYTASTLKGELFSPAVLNHIIDHGVHVNQKHICYNRACGWKVLMLCFWYIMHLCITSSVIPL